MAIYLKASCMDMDFYYKTDLDGEYGRYAENIQDKVKVLLALENDIDVADIETGFVLSVSRKNRLSGVIFAGEIKEAMC